MSDGESGKSSIVNEPMNEFGSDWTEVKAAIIHEYVKAYMLVMKNQRFQLLYFDGFAGSGEVQLKNATGLMESVALKILSVDEPRRFDRYVLVELSKKKVSSLEAKLNERYPELKDRIFVVEGDANEQLKKLAEYLKGNQYRRVLAFLDPFGMQVDHSAVQALKGLPVDLWVLFPSAIGVNRNLFRDLSKMEDYNWKSVEQTLGVSREKIDEQFYSPTLFDDIKAKRSDGIERTLNLYRANLQQLFKHVSQPKVLKNKGGGVMYHLLLASQQPVAIRIANHIIKKHDG